MARRRRGRAVSGILVLDKPLGVSSNHALQAAKRLYFAAKAGHTGSLDPLATDASRAEVTAHAFNLGLDACRGCPGCKCGVGIDLKGQVIGPLLQAAEKA